MAGTISNRNFYCVIISGILIAQISHPLELVFAQYIFARWCWHLYAMLWDNYTDGCTLFAVNTHFMRKLTC